MDDLTQRILAALIGGSEPSDDYTTAGVLRMPVSRGSVLPLTEYADGSVEFDPFGSGLTGAAYRAFTAPGRAVRGEIAPEQMADEGLNFAGMIGGGSYIAGASGAVPAGAVALGGAKAARSRSARARAMGYGDEPFYRGEANGADPDSYADGGAFFSRDQEYAQGFAQRGGNDAPREFRLNLQNAFRDYEPVTATAYYRIVKALEPELQGPFVDMVAPGKSPEWMAGFATHKPDFVVAENGALLRQALEQQSGNALGVFKMAGYDAIDSGRDVRKLTGVGIRHKDAAFNPEKATSTNIFHTLGWPIPPNEDRR